MEDSKLEYLLAFLVAAILLMATLERVTAPRVYEEDTAEYEARYEAGAVQRTAHASGN